MDQTKFKHYHFPEKYLVEIYKTIVFPLQKGDLASAVPAGYLLTAAKQRVSNTSGFGRKMEVYLWLSGETQFLFHTDPLYNSGTLELQWYFHSELLNTGSFGCVHHLISRDPLTGRTLTLTEIKETTNTDNERKSDHLIHEIESKN